MLSVSSLTAGYDGGTVLHGLNLEIPAGSIHAVVGHNGAGKTTLIQTVAGLVPTASGRVAVGRGDVTRLPAHRRAQAGIGLGPQGRRGFPGPPGREPGDQGGDRDGLGPGRPADLPALPAGLPRQQRRCRGRARRLIHRPGPCSRGR